MANTRSTYPFSTAGNPNHQSGNCQIMSSHHSSFSSSRSRSGANPPLRVGNSKKSVGSDLPNPVSSRSAEKSRMAAYAESRVRRGRFYCAADSSGFHAIREIESRRDLICRLRRRKTRKPGARGKNCGISFGRFGLCRAWACNPRLNTLLPRALQIRKSLPL